jgi:mRNA interferase RelE/StbE
MRLAFGRAAEKALSGLPADRRKQVLRRIKDIAADPTSRNFDVKRLASSDLFRLRVGNYRILFSVDSSKDVLTVELIRTRGDIYKR